MLDLHRRSWEKALDFLIQNQRPAMKKLLVIFALCLSSAYASDLQTHFDSLVRPSADQDEFTLKLSIDKNGSTAQVLKDILSNLYNVEDILISSIEVEHITDLSATVEKAIKELGLGEDGFYCHAFKGFEDGDYETGKCAELVRELLTPFFATKGLFRAKTIYVEGNDWGDLIFSHLILETQKEVIVIDFDIVHEI